MSIEINKQRRNFRFPAYDDQEGVKLHTHERRKLFEDDVTFLTKSDSRHEEKNYRRSAKKTAEMARHSIQQQEELEKHRSNLPDYGHRQTVEVSKTKPDIFGQNHRRAAHQTRPETPSEAGQTIKKEYSGGRSRFVPKYIPASVLPDTPKGESGDFAEQELQEAMHKPADSYLLFDQEPTAFQARNDEDPSVSRFKKTGEPAVGMTRKQYKKAAKSQQPPFIEKQKQSRLEQSIDGLLNENDSAIENSKYFS